MKQDRVVVKYAIWAQFQDQMGNWIKNNLGYGFRVTYSGHRHHGVGSVIWNTSPFICLFFFQGSCVQRVTQHFSTPRSLIEVGGVNVIYIYNWVLDWQCENKFQKVAMEDWFKNNYWNMMKQKWTMKLFFFFKF